jgi:hypothetical protein
VQTVVGSKRCSSCKRVLPTSSFHRRSAGDGFQAYCKECRKTIDQDYFTRTREVRHEQIAARKQRLAQWSWGVKSAQPCADCGLRFHPAAMHFDHLPGAVKVDNVSDLVRTGRRRLAELEILKCDIVCANCHAIRTYIRRLGIEPTQGSICETPAAYALN